ncbi:hypothetical protein RHSP_35369 [Rhizobium freirei PRF 81]|uniref:Uncharacterized protein n=1 Tax=Rhizobium freirei PRF 81 TaxID=363754 RepID=N6U0U9_9HYPH|nr:hypothetical protein RHSP_35369 [Rhizobium freirei PRF 81]
MEAQRQFMHVHEGPISELANRVLADAGKERIAKLVEAELDQAGKVRGDDQSDGADHEGRQDALHVELAVQRVDGPFEEIGDQQQEEFRNQQEDGRPDDAHLQVHAAGGPHIRPEIDDRVQWIAGIRRYGFLGLCHVRLRRRIKAAGRCTRWASPADKPSRT